MCGGTAALAGLQATYIETLRAAEVRSFNRVRLVDEQGEPLKATRLTTEEAYIFQYPYRSTPCFLISLPAKAGGPMTMQSEDGDYPWNGGIGPHGTLVSYNAICAHKLSYASREQSPIGYTGKTASKLAGRGGMIVCCEHERVYDPAQGGRMTAGKEPTSPLTAIVLEYDAGTDAIYAVGVAGDLLYEDFFHSYRRSLAAEYGPAAREETSGNSVAVLMSKYTRSIDRC